MNNSTDQSAFRFNGYKVIKSRIELKKDRSTNEATYSININPSGTKSGKFFELKLEVLIEDDNKAYSAYIEIVGDFEFEKDMELPDYFILNAPAILFPYVRAYVSSLTSLSGIDIIVIPTLNLTSLKERLANSISASEEKGILTSRIDD